MSVPETQSFAFCINIVNIQEDKIRPEIQTFVLGIFECTGIAGPQVRFLPEPAEGR